MASKFAVFIFMVFGVVVVQVAGQYGCRPNTVTNLQLRNDILTWDNVDSEICNISYYLVDIRNMGDGTEYAYQVTDKRFNVRFLAPCQEYRFMVTQVSTDELDGNGRILYATTTPPPEADLTLQYLRISQNPTWIRLEWALSEEWQPCASHYRVLIYNEDQDIAEDTYVLTTGISLTYLMPCTSYTFAVTAIYDLQDEGPPSVIRHQMLAYETTAPSLVSLTPRSRNIEMTWSVDYYIRNRCPITSLNVNAAPYFAISYPIQDDPDNRRPFSINVPGLTPDTMYHFNVSITNSAGVSPGSTVFVQTLDRD